MERDRMTVRVALLDRPHVVAPAVQRLAALLELADDDPDDILRAVPGHHVAHESLVLVGSLVLLIMTVAPGEKKAGNHTLGVLVVDFLVEPVEVGGIERVDVEDLEIGVLPAVDRAAFIRERVVDHSVSVVEVLPGAIVDHALKRAIRKPQVVVHVTESVSHEEEGTAIGGPLEAMGTFPGNADVALFR